MRFFGQSLAVAALLVATTFAAAIPSTGELWSRLGIPIIHDYFRR